MGKRGPRPEPRAIQIAKDTWRAKLKPGEPEEVVGEMVKPDWLGPIASAIWDAAMETLRGRNCVSPAYVDFLAMYCEAHEELHAAMKEIERDGMFCMSEKGAMYQHPAVGVKHKSMEFIARFGREFGFSPTSVRDIQQSAKPSETETKKRKYAGA